MIMLHELLTINPDFLLQFLQLYCADGTTSRITCIIVQACYETIHLSLYTRICLLIALQYYFFHMCNINKCLNSFCHV